MEILKNIIKKYFASFVYFYRYLRYRIFFVILLSIIVGTLDAFGLTMFLPMLQLSEGGQQATGENLGKLSFIVDGLKAYGIEFTLIVALSFLLFFFVMKGIATYFTSAYKVVVSQYFISTLRLRITNYFTQFSYKIFVSSDIGRIQNSFTSEVDRVSNAFRNYSDGLQQLFMTLIYMVFVFLIEWKFALLVCAGGLFTNIVYTTIYKKTKKESLELSKRNSSYHGFIIQYITNFKYLKATGFLSRYSQKLKVNIKDIEATNKRIGILNAQITGSREPLLIIVVCAVILIQVYTFHGQLASILISLLLFYRALTALIGFQNYYNTFLGNSGSLENMELFEEELRRGKEQEGSKEIKQFNKSIALQDLSFNYGTESSILKGINLTIEKDQTVAFAGESGSGKTTLVNLICALIPPSKGEIRIDDFNIFELNKLSYQSRIGYISQEPVIFNDTIFNNVTFWAEPTEENMKRFDEAIRKASIHTFVADLKGKKDTYLGNNGINLSGGQRQRISIARELYKDIDILILDEATSALDSETEKEIQHNIDQLKGKYTILIIAHRLSTIKNADKVYLMDKGEIIGSGSFNELIKSSERFKKMVELQEI